MQTEVPIQPGGVPLEGVAISGGVAPFSRLENIGSSTPSDSDTFGPIPRLFVSTFQINYTAVDCGTGISLLTGLYGDMTPVSVERVAAGSEGISGNFTLSFGGRTLRTIQADISAYDLEQLLEINFPGEGGLCPYLAVR